MIMPYPTFSLLLESHIIGFDLICDACDEMTFEIKATNRVKYQPDGYMYLCPNCNTTRSIRRASIFSGSPYSLQQICDLIYSFAVLHSNQTLNAELIERCVDNSGKWFLVFRKCIALWFADNPVVLGAHGTIVEVDETSLTTKPKYGISNNSTRRDARWILGLVERGPRQRHIYLGAHRRRQDIIPVIVSLIVAMAVIMTDNFVAYWSLSEIGYHHCMVNHSIEFVNQHNSDIHTETVEGNFKHLKQDLNRNSGVRTKYIQLYLDEYDFRCMYLRDKKKAWFVIARLLGEYGHQALHFVKNMNDHHY
eukprot:218902_1